MPKIIQIPIPNTSIFEPVTSVYENNLTYVEFLLGILKKLNETITQVNDNTSFIENYDERIEAVEKAIATLRSEVEASIDSQNQYIEQRFNEITASLNGMINALRLELKSYSDTLYRELDAKIDQVAVGQINVYNPATGMIQPLQDVLNDLAGQSKKGLTATEYDELELTATAYDAYQISAYNYDYNGKEILTT